MEDNSQKPKILIVDDTPENILALKIILKKMNVDVVTAGSGPEALSSTLHHDFSLILLDVMMPGMDGYEVAELLHKDTRTSDIPIIFITAMDKNDAMEIKGYSKGAVDFIFKPVNEVVLTTKINIYLELYQKKKYIETILLKQQTENPKILIVDDNSENLFVLEKILKKLKADIISADSGNEALSATLYHDFALIILDVQMPEMDGYEVAEILKENEKTENIPIIFITAIDRDSVKEIKGYKKGAVDFIFKPLNEFILTSKVNIFLDIYKMKSGLEKLVRERTLELEQTNTLLSDNNIRLKKLVESTRELASHSNVDSFCSHMLDEFAHHMNAPSNGSIYLVKKDGLKLLSSLEPEHTPDYLPFPLPEHSVQRRVMESIKAFAPEDTTKDAATINPCGWKEYQNGTVLAFPMQDNIGRVIGILSLDKKTDSPFSEQDKEIGNILASYSCETLKALQASDAVQESERQLHQSQKMESLGTLAGGIAHDFNNILFPIIGYAEMLLNDVSKDSSIHTSLGEIYTSAMRAKDLVQQILTFAHKETTELVTMKMQSIIKEALKLIRSTIPATIEIQQDINPHCGFVKADPTQIHQIIMNLATNAYHAMQKTGGQLKVSLKEIKLENKDLLNPDMTPGDYALLTIADSGIGIKKNVMGKIFDPFFTTKDKSKGTGMGLSVVHGIVKSMDGEIQVYSEPDKGTEFKVYIPVEKNSMIKNKIKTKNHIQGGTEKILLVDDEESILVMEKKMLTRLGYQVNSYLSSIDALEAFRSGPDKFDLVITDMAMPGLPGDKLSYELTQIRGDIPILLCTGFSETMSEEKVVSLGIKGLLFKPIAMKDLSKKIREVLDGAKSSIQD